MNLEKLQERSRKKHTPLLEKKDYKKVYELFCVKKKDRRTAAKNLFRKTKYGWGNEAAIAR